jgi:hypothetical protein
MSDLTPEQQAVRRQDMALGGLLALEGGAMMMPSSGIAEMMGAMPDPMGEGYLPSTADLIAEGDLEGLGYQLLGAAGDVMYAVSPLTGGLLAIPATAAKGARAAKLATPSVGGTTGLTPARKQLILKEVEATRNFDPSASSFFHGLKNREDMTQLPVYTEQRGILMPQKTIELADKKGEYMIPAYGDRSAGGLNLLGYGDKKFEQPVPLQAGKDYARNQGNAIWNTDRHKNRYKERALQAQEEGTEANLIYTTMAGDSGDFNKMTTNTWLQSLDVSKISKADADKIDEKLRNFKTSPKKPPNNPDWPGIFSDELPKYLNELGNSKSANLFKELSKGMYEKAGLPKMDEVRRAQTSDDLLYVPTYRSGGMIGKMKPQDELSDLVEGHDTYTRSGNIVGDYEGELEIPVPDILIFRDVAERFMDESGDFLLRPSDGRPFDRANLKYTIDAQAPMQMVDDQMLEDVDFYYRSLLGR